MAVRKKSRPSPKNALSEMSRKLDRLEKKIDFIKKEQLKTEKEVHEELENSEEAGKEIQKVEEELLELGRFTFEKEHVMELARGAAGAFLGVGIGMGIRYMPGVAESLEWANAIGILIFIFALGGMLIYKNEKDWIKKQGMAFIPKRLIHLFIIAIGVDLVALVLFNVLPAEPELLIKTLIVGSYPAMSGAITFTIA